MFDSLSTVSEALKLNFQSTTRVAGETLFGSVDYNFAKGQEERIELVRVKLRGSISTRIRRSNGQSSTTYRQTIPLVRDDCILWSQGGAFPPAGSHNLAMPFTFELPPLLPPSFHCSHGNSGGTISYSIEVVGERPGFFVRNRRVGVVFPVVPSAIPAEIDARVQLAEGWTGLSRSYIQQDQIRTGLWGDRSTVEAEIIMPDLPSYAIATPIPFHVRITTTTKPLKKSAHPLPVDKKGEPLFPAPPTTAAEVVFRLDRAVRVVARGRRSAFVNTAIPAISAMGYPVPPSHRDEVRMVVSDPEWVSGEVEGTTGEDKGMWRRTVAFTSTMQFTCPPSLETPILGCAYSMHLTIPFPGIGNDLKWDLPVQLDSGVPTPPPPIGQAGSSTAVPYGQHVYDQRLVLDLPPAYFNGEDHDWDGDEKKG